MPGNGVPHLLGADSGAAGPASGCSGHSLKMCPSDGQSAARAQRYASQLEQLVDENGVVAAMVDEIESPTKHGGCKADEYIPGLATIEAHTPLRQHRGRDARAGGLGNHAVCSRTRRAVSSVSYSNEAVTSRPTATGGSRQTHPGGVQDTDPAGRHDNPSADRPRRRTWVARRNHDRRREGGTAQPWPPDGRGQPPLGRALQIHVVASGVWDA
jgi:hypothetical protein